MNAGQTEMADGVIPWWLRPCGWRGLAVVLPIVVGAYLVAAGVTIRRSNQDWKASDQGAEMWLANQSQGDWFPQRTDGVRHPLWSWLARHVYGDDKAEFFARGKWLNVAICAAFLCALGVVVARWLDPLATTNLLLLCGFGILLVRGTYFQPEPIYYVMSFLAAVVGWRLLRGAGFLWWPAFGAVCGIAYLAKPSLAPFLMVFAAAWGVGELLRMWQRRGVGPLARLLGGPAVAAAIFGAILVPLGIFSHQHFGKPFFNYTRYWVWMDDFETEAWPFQDKFPGRAQLAQLPAADTPSAGWYLRRHTLGDAWERLRSGAGEVWERFFFPEPKLPAGQFFWRSSPKRWEQPLTHRGVYVIVLGALCLVLAVAVPREVAERLAAPSGIARAVFVVGMLCLYVALYGWYWPIGRGDRFMGSLWIPSAFLLVWLASELRGRAPSRWAGCAYAGVHAAVLLTLAVQVAGLFWRFQHGIFLTTRN